MEADICVESSKRKHDSEMMVVLLPTLLVNHTKGDNLFHVILRLFLYVNQLNMNAIHFN